MILLLPFRLFNCERIPLGWLVAALLNLKGTVNKRSRYISPPFGWIVSRSVTSPQ